MEWHRKFKLSEHFTLCLLFVRYYESVHFYLFKEYLLDAIYCSRILISYNRLMRPGGNDLYIC